MVSYLAFYVGARDQTQFLTLMTELSPSLIYAIFYLFSLNAFFQEHTMIQFLKNVLITEKHRKETFSFPVIGSGLHFPSSM